MINQHQPWGSKSYTVPYNTTEMKFVLLAIINLRYIIGELSFKIIVFLFYFQGVLVEVEYCPGIIPNSCWGLLAEFMQVLNSVPEPDPPGSEIIFASRIRIRNYWIWILLRILRFFTPNLKICLKNLLKSERIHHNFIHKT